MLSSSGVSAGYITARNCLVNRLRHVLLYPPVSLCMFFSCSGVIKLNLTLTLSSWCRVVTSLLSAIYFGDVSVNQRLFLLLEMVIQAEISSDGLTTIISVSLPVTLLVISSGVVITVSMEEETESPSNWVCNT